MKEFDVSSKSLNVSTGLGILSVLLLFPFIANEVVDWCGYDGLCGRDTIVALLSAFGISVFIGILVGVFCNLALRRIWGD